MRSPTVGRVGIYGDAPAEVEGRLREICRELPEAYEEPAWAGLCWRVRRRTVVRLLTVQRDWAPDFGDERGGTDRRTVLTFKTLAGESASLAACGFPFYLLGWGHDSVGMVLSGDTDWSEVRELVTDSYCTVAPRMLVARIARPP
ncbi:hypothetical protein GCM10022236_10910 [Microlunatus ginsengisoli]|uniref:YjbR protein n=1 Tax=Microlunatus ginsengisoli TaxID=363863 RepID=A0ABP6ZKT2_9ACTN